MNSNGRLHDIWLLYACPACGEGRKRSVYRRVRADAVSDSIEAYRRDDPLLVARHALAFAPAGARLEYDVERAPLQSRGVLRARIVQPVACGVRWDRLLARELAWSRSTVRTAWKTGALELPKDRRLRHPVQDGEVFAVWLDWT